MIRRWLPDHDIIFAFQDRRNGKETSALVSCTKMVKNVPRTSILTTSNFLLYLSPGYFWLKEWLRKWLFHFFPALEGGGSGTVGIDVTLQADKVSLPLLLVVLTFTGQFFYHFSLLLWLLPHNCGRTSLFFHFVWCVHKYKQITTKFGERGILNTMRNLQMVLYCTHGQQKLSKISSFCHDGGKMVR